MSRESAGAAIRALRESRDWSLAELAAATGVSIMGLSYLERGARKPHKGTVQKVENGLGLPPGTYSRLLVAADPDAELARLMAAQPPAAMPARRAGPVAYGSVDTEAKVLIIAGSRNTNAPMGGPPHPTAFTATTSASISSMSIMRYGAAAEWSTITNPPTAPNKVGNGSVS